MVTARNPTILWRRGSLEMATAVVRFLLLVSLEEEMLGDLDVAVAVAVAATNAKTVTTTIPNTKAMMAWISFSPRRFVLDGSGTALATSGVSSTNQILWR